MKKLVNQEEGIAHLLMILVFVVAFVALGAFAYSRVSDNQTADPTETSQEDTVEGEDEDLDTGEEQTADTDLEKAEQEVEQELQQEAQ